MNRWSGKVAVVTGASSGIGEAIVNKLVENGLKVVGLARRLEKMQAIAKNLELKGKFYPFQCDVSNEENILQAFKYANSLGGVDVLVNNAGVAYPQYIIDGDTEKFRAILDVNVLSTAICSREATKSMKERKVEGHIINMNSISGHNVSEIKAPLSLYQTSKFAITGMSQVLANELITAKLPIKVTNLSPGLVKTDMPIFESYGGEKMFAQLPYMQAKDVADAVVYILSTPPHIQVKELTIEPMPLNA